MRIMFWNIRGLGTPHRRGFVTNHILQEDLDIVALQETIKQDFSDQELREMAGNQDLNWTWSPARGHSRGLVVGIKTELFEIEQEEVSDTFIRILIRNRMMLKKIRNRITNFRYWVVNVYGHAHHEFSGDFISELSSFCEKETLPIILGGDFNLIRNNRDRNQGQGDPKLMDLCNDFIGNFQLREIFVSGNKFTWSNKQRNPTLIKLDRILATVSWESQYPTCFSWSKSRIGSDHTPLILDSGENGASRTRYFFFEEKWTQTEGFEEMVRNKWIEFQQSFSPNSYSLNRWHGCLQSMRQYLRGWNLKLIGQQKETKCNLTKRIEEIDLIAESRLLTFEEWEERIQAEKDLESFVLMEELQWKQRAGKNWVLHGDTNTHFFHQYSNGRRRTNTIAMLESDSGEIRGQKEMTDHIVQFYKQLFGHNDACLLRLSQDFWPENLHLTESDKLDLIKEFNIEEIRDVVFDMNSNSAPGPNGFGVIFFKKYWESIKGDIFLYVHGF